jgi:hypothetical protein
MKVSDFLDDFEDDETPSSEPIRRDNKPVSGRHDLQRRSENAKNRFRKLRNEKENKRNSD